MSLTIFDHLLVVILVLVLPVVGVSDHRRLLSRLRAGRRTARLVFYREAMAWSWGLAVAVAALWLANGRDIAQLGLGWEAGWGFWIALVLTAVACGLAIAQSIWLRRDREKLQAAGASVESVQALIPRTRREWREFAALSITVGICEELLFRGYLMIYITWALATDSMWPAALLSSLAFGLYHAYQGPKGVARTGAVGLIMAGLYLLGGSLWLPVVLHAVIDLVAGSIGRAALGADEAAEGPPCLSR